MLPRSGKRSPCFAGGSAGAYQADEAWQQAQESRDVIRAYNTFIVLTTALVAEQLFADELYRAYFEVQNRGPGNIYLSLGQLPQAPGLNFPGAIWVPPLGYYPRDFNVPVDTIYCVSDVAGTIVTAVQGVRSVN